MHRGQPADSHESKQPTACGITYTAEYNDNKKYVRFLQPYDVFKTKFDDIYTILVIAYYLLLKSKIKMGQFRDFSFYLVTSE